MTSTLVGYGPTLAAEHADDLRRAADAARLVRQARKARRERAARQAPPAGLEAAAATR